MNNKTIEKFTIKRRGDGVYDLYVNDVHMVSKGHYESILNEIRKIIKEIDAE